MFDVRVILWFCGAQLTRYVYNDTRWIIKNIAKENKEIQMNENAYEKLVIIG